MSIWRIHPTAAELTERGRGNLAGHLGIRITTIGDDFLEATMPVEPRLHQPFGVLHGGASLALAETVGSVAAMLCVTPEEMCLGQEINANHLRAVREGTLTATARPWHLGRRSQVWHIEIRDAAERLVCISRLTMAVVPRGREGAA
ncbi:MAG: hotdog fold thioesterase [Gammaproteobacteria bacterium]|nr:hotdog fold thioesterase [Gammaproteobacteria bacterium]MBV9696343.1 hotdog fold thioesterase [Gammaproteobacteria bacterium]